MRLSNLPAASYRGPTMRTSSARSPEVVAKILRSVHTVTIGVPGQAKELRFRYFLMASFLPILSSCRPCTQSLRSANRAPE